MFLLLGLLGGLVTGISPCILPVLPVLFLGAAGGKETANAATTSSSGDTNTVNPGLFRVAPGVSLGGGGTPAVAAAGTIRSQAMVRSTSSTSMPSTATEAMVRAQLLLKFPPADEQMDEWRATIQSLLGFAEAGGLQRAGPPRPPQATTTARVAGRTEGATPMIQSPPWQLARAHQNQEPDDVLMASSDPRACPGRRRAPEERRMGDMSVIIEQQSDDPR